MTENNDAPKKPPRRIRHKQKRNHIHRAEKAKAGKRAKMEQKKKKSRVRHGKGDR
jgi:hypothetical protein